MPYFHVKIYPFYMQIPCFHAKHRAFCKIPQYSSASQKKKKSTRILAYRASQDNQAAMKSA